MVYNNSKKKLFFIIFILIVSFYFFIFSNFSKKTELAYSGELLVKLKNSPKIYKINVINFPYKKIHKEWTSIEWMEPNYSLKASFLPNDPFFSKQQYLNKIGATQTWDLVKGGNRNIVVAILDTGIDIDHPDLKKNIWVNINEIVGDGIDNDDNGYIDDIHGWDFIRNIPDPNPKFDEAFDEAGINHGTIVAGQIASQGNNKEGIIGLAYNTTIMPLRVLNSQGQGTVEDVINGINYAVANGAKIINLSFVGENESYFLTEALKNAWDKGIIIVAASGNQTTGAPLDLDKNPTYPICLDDKNDNFIIGVAATDQNDKKAIFSDYGSRCVDISAPGTRIYAPLVYYPEVENFNEYYGGYWSGSSLSCPLVSATAALIWSINPLFSQEQVRDIILNNTDEILDEDYATKLGTGRLNVYQSIKCAYDETHSLSQNYYIVTGAGPGGGPHVRTFTSSGLGVTSFFAYNEHFHGGVNIAVGDVDGDGLDDIVTGAGPGGGPHVRIFDMYGHPKGSFFAYNEHFHGGVNIAVGDVDGDGLDDIVTGAGPGGGPHVRIFDMYGHPKGSFFAYNEHFHGGVNIAVGDVDGDGLDDIVTGAGPGGGPHVRIFGKTGNLELQFFAFNKKFKGGVQVACGDVANIGIKQIIVGVASGASPYIRVFDTRSISLELQFLAYSKNFYKGINIASADLDGNGQAEIVVGQNKGGLSEIKIFTPEGENISQFMAYNEHFHGGVNVAIMKVNK